MSATQQLSLLEAQTLGARLQKHFVCGISPEACWEWTGERNNNGYGTVGFFKSIGPNKTKRIKREMAHRLSYRLHTGPLADDLDIDHLCRNRACVNPAHLEAVPHRENMRRAASLITHCPQGHEYTPANTLIRRNGKRQCRVCNRIAARNRYIPVGAR